MNAMMSCYLMSPPVWPGALHCRPDTGQRPRLRRRSCGPWCHSWCKGCWRCTQRWSCNYFCVKLNPFQMSHMPGCELPLLENVWGESSRLCVSPACHHRGDRIIVGHEVRQTRGEQRAGEGNTGAQLKIKIYVFLNPESRNIYLNQSEVIIECRLIIWGVRRPSHWSKGHLKSYAESDNGHLRINVFDVLPAHH